jgi:hypothetical protein
MSAFLRHHFSQHFRRFTRVAARLLHTSSPRHLSSTLLRRSIFFEAIDPRLRLRRGLHTVGLGYHGEVGRSHRPGQVVRAGFQLRDLRKTVAVADYAQRQRGLTAHLEGHLYPLGRHRVKHESPSR